MGWFIGLSALKMVCGIGMAGRSVLGQSGSRFAIGLIAGLKSQCESRPSAARRDFWLLLRLLSLWAGMAVWTVGVEGEVRLALVVPVHAGEVVSGRGQSEFCSDLGQARRIHRC